MKRVLLFLLLSVCSYTLLAQSISMVMDTVVEIKMLNGTSRIAHIKVRSDSVSTSSMRRTRGMSKPVASEVCTICGKPSTECQYNGRHPKTMTGFINGQQWVDLGLSVMWATCNVGAIHPGDYGGYYKLDGETAITPTSGRDIARENWGSAWRMPTVAEFNELCEKCQWTWTTRNKHDGYLVTGPNGNCIFLPAAGWGIGMDVGYRGESGNYWASTLWKFCIFSDRYTLNFNSSNHFTKSTHLRIRQNVRPVIKVKHVLSTAQNTGPTTGTINGHEWVDLGLSVKWATCNVGADSPGDYGGYYAWGETRTKSSYDWSNYFDYVDGEEDDFRKYKFGTYKNGEQTRIAPSSGHDIARESWGGTWRMPTEGELNELCERCQRKWTTRNGHNGYVVTGPNGNSIFLPAAGWRDGTSSYYVGEACYYRSSTLSPYNSIDHYFYFSGERHLIRAFRKNGLSVRPVTE